MNYEVLNGLPYPLGALFDGNGVNFAIYSSNATRVQLCLFNKNGGGEKRIDLPQYTDEVFHGYVKGLKPGQLYGYRVYGPYEPEKGHRFNPNKLLLPITQCWGMYRNPKKRIYHLIVVILPLMYQNV